MMTDDFNAEGGAANTPPFPRNPPPASAAGRPDEGETTAAGERENYPEDRSADRFADVDSEAPLPPPHRAARKPASRVGEEILKRGERTLYHGLAHVADQLEDTAHRIEHLADDRLAALGPRMERATGAVQTASSWLTGTAEYLRAADLEGIEKDLERQVRDKPLQTLLVAAGAGWILGKIIR